MSDKELLKNIFRHLVSTGFLSRADLDKAQLAAFFRRLEKALLPEAGHEQAFAGRAEKLVAFTDGASLGNPGPAGIGVSLQVDGVEVETIAEHIGKTTNNVAEYMALLAALRAAKKYNPEHFLVYMDSQLIVRQIQGAYKVKQAHLKPLFEQAKKLIADLNSVELQHVPREENTRADELSRAGIPGKK